MSEEVVHAPEIVHTPDECAKLSGLSRASLLADKLDPREAQIIADHYLRDKPLMLDEVGSSLGVSRQRQAS